MSLNLIFQIAKANGKNVIRDNRTYFAGHYDPKWFDDPVVRNILEQVDNDKVLFEDIIETEDGAHIPARDISTGAKTAILVWEFPDVIFNMTQCGNNAFKCVVDICEVYDRTEMTYRYLPMRLLERIKVTKDGEEFDMKDYPDLIDEWLLESLND